MGIWTMGTLFGFGLLLTAAIVAAPAQAQDRYPSKAITLVVPVPPGGAADLIARLIGRKLSDAMGQPVVVSNRGVRIRGTAELGGLAAQADHVENDPQQA